MRSIGTLVSEASRMLFNDPTRAGRIREDKQKHKMDLLKAEIAGNIERQKTANEGQLGVQGAQNQGALDVTKLKGDIEQGLRDSQIAENVSKSGYYENASKAALTEATAKSGLYDEQAKGLANNNFLESLFGRDIAAQTLRNKQLANNFSQVLLTEKLADAVPKTTSLDKATDTEFMLEWEKRKKLRMQ